MGSLPATSPALLALALSNASVDLRGNPLSCCSGGSSTFNMVNSSYDTALFNWSAPRLPVFVRQNLEVLEQTNVPNMM